MQLFMALLAVAVLFSQYSASPTGFSESSNVRVKRADCTSSYGEWSDWSTCTMDCGYCGTQSRSRTCTAVDGCATVTCTGDSTEAQDCGTNNVVCLYPNPSCCNKDYKKMIDWNVMTFVCLPKDSTPMPVPAKPTTNKTS